MNRPQSYSLRLTTLKSAELEVVLYVKCGSGEFPLLSASFTTSDHPKQIEVAGGKRGAHRPCERPFTNWTIEPWWLGKMPESFAS